MVTDFVCNKIRAGKERKFAFVKNLGLDSLQRACQELNGRLLSGASLKVRKAKYGQPSRISKAIFNVEGQNRKIQTLQQKNHLVLLYLRKTLTIHGLKSVWLLGLSQKSIR